MRRPHHAAAHVERDELAGAEPREYLLAVSDDGRGGKVVLLVERGERAARLEPVFPEPSAVAPAERLDDEDDGLGRARRRLAASANRPFPHYQRGVVAGQRRVRTAAVRHPADLRGHDDLIAPYDRRGRSKAAQRGAPCDVLAGTPRDRQPDFG